jgi:hypothetical protein
MRIIRTNIATDKEWNEFLGNHYNMFFDNRFLDYNDFFGKGLLWHHVKVKDDAKNKVIALLTGCEIIKNSRKVFISCNGVSFGGFLWREKTGINEMMETLDSFKLYTSENHFDEIIIRNPPNIYKSDFNEEYEYSLISKGFEVVNYAITNIIDLQDFVFEKLANPKKRSINKSENNIEIETLNGPLDYNSFIDYYNVLLENRLKKNVQPTHSIDELIYLKNELSDKIKIFSAKINRSIAGICILFIIQNDIILNFYLATDEQYKKERVADFLLYKSIDWAKKNHYRLYDIGTSNVGKEYLPGLFDFKKKFMADGFLRKTFKLTLNK